MYVDIWVFGIFAILFGFCAVWNQKAGISRGVEGTFDFLIEKGIVKVEDGVVSGVPNKKVEIDVEIKFP